VTGEANVADAASASRERRSWLIVPASEPNAIAVAARCGTDVVVVDLVELITDKDRVSARDGCREGVAAAGIAGASVFAQIDPVSFLPDLNACTWPGLAGIVISRAESAAQVEAISAALDDLEATRGLPAGSVQIVAALETPQGNHAAHDILRASQRVCAATLGRADLVMDLRPEPSGEIHLMPYLMQRLIIIAGTVGVMPLGAWWREPDRGLIATPENTYEAAYRGRAIGFKGAMCLQSHQVDAINRAFT
jgi:citrate lyase subunit beta / citryl-CoA lyase